MLITSAEPFVSECAKITRAVSFVCTGSHAPPPAHRLDISSSYEETANDVHGRSRVFFALGKPVPGNGYLRRGGIRAVKVANAGQIFRRDVI